MTEADFASSERVIRWEFRYQSDEAECRDAVRGIGRLAPRSFPFKAAVVIVGLTLALILLTVLAWFAFWVSAVAIKGFAGRWSPEARSLAYTVTSVSVFFCATALIRYVVSLRQERRKKRTLQGLVRLYDDDAVSFVDSGVTVEAKAEKYESDDSFFYIRIEGGKRFVFIPRRCVDSLKIGEFERFIQERRLIG